jgi:hypothetical protein
MDSFFAVVEMGCSAAVADASAAITPLRVALPPGVSSPYRTH